MSDARKIIVVCPQLFLLAGDITLRLGSLMLDLGNGDEIHIDNFNSQDVFNSSNVGSFEFADFVWRSKSEAANDETIYAWRIAA